MKPAEEIYTKLKLYFPFLYFCLLTVILFSGNTHSLTDQDEAAYAGFAKQMIESGNWVTLEFMWSEVHRKPPLHFWNIALSYKVFGVNEFAVRFPAALFVWLTCLLVFVAGKRIAGPKTALLWVVVLSTSLLIPALGKISVTDSTLLFFTTACAFSFYFVLEERKWKWVLVFWVSFALALLTKGPPVVLFALGLAGLLLILHPKRRNLILFHPWLFLPLAVLPLLAWGYATTRYDNGKFIEWMIDWYILKRVGGSVFGQSGFPGMHLLMVVLFFIPWLLFLPQAFKELFTRFFKDKQEGLFFSAWFVAGWFIFELSPSKLPAYVVAAHVPLAFFIARFASEQKLPAKLWLIIHYLIAFSLFAALVAVPLIINVSAATKVLFVSVGVVLLAASISSLFVLRTKWFLPALISVAVLLQVGLWQVLVPATDAYKNITKQVADYATAHADKTSSVLIANGKNKPPSLPFYLGNTFKSIQDEYDFSVLLKYYYSDSACVFILNEKQNALFAQTVSEVVVKKTEPLQELKQAFPDYYIIIKPENEKANRLPLPEWLEQPLTQQAYEEGIRSNPQWLRDLEAKAKEQNRSVEELLVADALWLAENDLRRYNYLTAMLQNPRWKTDLETRAASRGISLEAFCREEVEFVFKQGRVY
ncbi:MAG: Undecaprenyl phosphate-alpha-4-amino-4-deoxy-L-arabinose arabinosyl transferase [Bacteroidia bacterium]|nr:Undecaprenyl phosphate-alpha-4-amino-4-deoxy-L-arabinose arabinosyl transferase [Bacteroidia bacterium]